MAEFIEQYCEQNNMDKGREDIKDLLRTDEKNQIKCHRELSHLKTWKATYRMGTAGDNPNVVNTVSFKGEGKKFIRHITLCTAEWNEQP